MLSQDATIKNGRVVSKDEIEISDKNITGIIDKITIKAVDGTKIRDNTDIDFTEGGHGYVYDYIPKDEIWIDYSEAKKDTLAIIIHEFTERLVMKTLGIDYDTVHEDFANAVETTFRDVMKKKGLMK